MTLKNFNDVEKYNTEFLVCFFFPPSQSLLSFFLKKHGTLINI